MEEITLEEPSIKSTMIIQEYTRENLMASGTERSTTQGLKITFDATYSLSNRSKNTG
jgi:hypothetical protein